MNKTNILPDYNYLLHYTSKELGELVTYPPETQYMGMKPKGLWVSVEGGDLSWWDWCKMEDFGNLDISYRIELIEEPNILRIASAKDLDEFTEEYGYREYVSVIDWVSVAQKYQGIIITPYLWERRFKPKTTWYYSWDCESGCIWDMSAIKSVTKEKDYRKAVAQ